MFGIAGIRQWVYPQSVKGRFQRAHRWSGLVLQLVLFVTPWILVDGRPLLLINLDTRRLYLLGGVFTPSDTAFLAVLGLGSAFALFFFTSLFGRLWCGYACPQTVFLEEWVRPIEKFFEGDRGQRMALDKAPWTAKKVSKKVCVQVRRCVEEQVPAGNGCGCSSNAAGGKGGLLGHGLGCKKGC